MGKIEINEVTYAPWGRCVRVSNGSIEFLATLDFGPRIIRAGFIGGENFMFENKEKSISNALLGKFGDEDTWYIYGGHRFWQSPEALPRSYTPENIPVRYDVLEDGVRLYGNFFAYNGIRYEIDVRMEQGDKITLTHRATNENAWPITFAPWCLTVLAQGGKEVVPQPDKDTGLLHNRNLTLWPYTKMNDGRVYWGDKYITLRQVPGAESAFKFGLNSQHGWAAYFLHGGMFLKRFTPNPNGTYPDDGASFETYTNEHFLEMETLGELKLTDCGETVTHCESWEFYKGIAEPDDKEEEIARIMERVL